MCLQARLHCQFKRSPLFRVCRQFLEYHNESNVQLLILQPIYYFEICFDWSCQLSWDARSSVDACIGSSFSCSSDSISTDALSFSGVSRTVHRPNTLKHNKRWKSELCTRAQSIHRSIRLGKWICQLKIVYINYTENSASGTLSRVAADRFAPAECKN